jgi:site-specific recombinase XerD
MNQLITTRAAAAPLPALVAASGEQAARCFINFFTSNIRNRHTREAYRRAVKEFLAWCQKHGVRSLAAVAPHHVATWIELLGRESSPPTVKQKLAAIRHLFDWLRPGI